MASRDGDAMCKDAPAYGGTLEHLNLLRHGRFGCPAHFVILAMHHAVQQG